jgi:HlyD family type I secretion membrane fusion protein
MIEAVAKSHPVPMPETRRFAFPTRASFLSQAVLLEEAGPPRAPMLACILGFFFVSFAIIAAAFIDVDVISASPGRIAASSGNYIVQSFEGGIVDRVAAEEGQIVDGGDLLVSLIDPEAEAQFDRLTVREAGLAAQVDRQRKLADLPDRTTSRPPSENPVIFEQMSILPLERDAMRAEQALIEAEIRRRLETIQNLRDLESDTRSELTLIEEELAAKRHLYTKGLTPRADLRETEREAASAASDLTEVQGQIHEAEAILIESRERLSDVIAEQRQRHGDRLSSLLLELSETRQQIKTLRQRLRRAQIKATGRGIIQEITVKHPGQTVAPNDPIAEIIPIDSGLLAEVRLPPSEIGHVREGQPVRLAIDGIEPHRHGYIEAEVSLISPSTFLDENGMPYYRASIGLTNERLNDIPLAPGMTLQAQIKTGERTILEYLLKPIYRAWDTSFRER